MAGKYDTQKGLLSELQWQILRHICATKESGYESIGRETGKARTTIIQSTNPLVKHGYIEKVKVDRTKKNYKIFFVPTFKGKSFTWYLARPRIRVGDIFNSETDTEINNYLDIINQISEPSQRESMSNEFASNLLNSPIIGRNGNISTEDKISSIKGAFHDGIMELVQNAKYDPKDLLNDNTLKWLNEHFSTAELKELKETLLRISENADSTAKLLSKLDS